MKFITHMHGRAELRPAQQIIRAALLNHKPSRWQRIRGIFTREALLGAGFIVATFALMATWDRLDEQAATHKAQLDAAYAKGAMSMIASHRKNGQRCADYTLENNLWICNQ
jgi:hypothetical protein